MTGYAIIKVRSKYFILKEKTYPDRLPEIMSSILKIQEVEKNSGIWLPRSTPSYLKNYIKTHNIRVEYIDLEYRDVRNIFNEAVLLVGHSDDIEQGERNVFKGQTGKFVLEYSGAWSGECIKVDQNEYQVGYHLIKENISRFLETYIKQRKWEITSLYPVPWRLEYFLELSLKLLSVKENREEIEKLLGDYEKKLNDEEKVLFNNIKNLINKLERDKDILDQGYKQKYDEIYKRLKELAQGEINQVLLGA